MRTMNPERRRPGFTLPGYAAAAARKNHELGTAHRFTPEEAKAAYAKRVENQARQARAEETTRV